MARGRRSPPSGKTQISGVEGAASMYASVCPSGDHDGASCRFALVVRRWAAPLPSAGFQKRLLTPAVADANVTRCPSGGVQTAEEFLPSVVTFVKVPRGMSYTQTLRSLPCVHVNNRWPSGESRSDPYA